MVMTLLPEPGLRKPFCRLSRSSNLRTAMTSNQHRRLSSVSKIALLLALIVISPAITTAQVYSVLTFDGKGDGRDPFLADAAQLAYRYDKQQDFLWFRI